MDDSVRIFYRLVGSGRDTLVLIHGGPGFSMKYFAADLEPLATRHALLFYDQRGAGRSTLVADSARLDAERFVDDLEALRQHFRLERVNLLGHSWGAAVAAIYAARHPDRIGRLVIVGGLSPRFTPHVPQAFQNVNARFDSAGRERLQHLRDARRAAPGDASICRAYYELWFSVFHPDTSVMGRSGGAFCDETPEALINKLLHVDRYVARSMGDWDFRAALRAVTAPVLVIHGTLDPIPMESAHDWAALPNARLLRFDGVSHFPWLEVPEPFFAAISHFLEGGWPAGAR